LRKILVLFVVGALVAGGAWYYKSSSQDTASAAGTPVAGRGAGGATTGGARPGGAGRAPMTVDTATASRHEVVDYITVVGNLIGEATVDVVPRVAGRIDTMNVKLGDRVSKGMPIAKIEDREIREQINQAQATLEVNKANVSQRDNELQVQQIALNRAKNGFERGITARQNLEDAEARFNAAQSALIVAKSQQQQTQSRIDELKITLSNTIVLSPVNGFVSRRMLDQGAFANANTVLLTVVDIGTVRLVANLVEKGFRKVTPGVEAKVQVDTFAGEDFTGRVSRVAPVFDPATRTAQMEIEVPNPGFRLKPGMYARVRLTVERHPDALTVPANAVVDVDGKRGVYIIKDQTAKFVETKVGLSDGTRIEILEGLEEGQRVITTGSLAIRDGERVALPTTGQGGRGGGGRRGSGDGAASGASTPGRGR